MNSDLIKLNSVLKTRTFRYENALIALLYAHFKGDIYSIEKELGLIQGGRSKFSRGFELDTYKELVGTTLPRGSYGQEDKIYQTKEF